MDFTRKKYKELISALKGYGYRSITFSEYMQGVRPEKFVILRHDVDLLPYHSLAVSRIEHENGMKASYYFRAVPESWNEEVIKTIHSLGHEVGYHYESLTTCKGDMEAALKDFKMNLTTLRELVPVQTICMHGSPKSPYDSKLLWGKDNSYRDLNIIGEPYFDVDFSDVFYLTDTGRQWDSFKVSVRDKIGDYQEVWNREGLVFHSTDDILRGIGQGRIPPHVMITTHPQRWNESYGLWLKELLLQKSKNVIKRVLVKAGNHKC
ncbi:MAG: hypothetical protein Q4B16_04620 [Bacteroidia bacterium]|nr:hypothetical protein [Bacteroidia bacterium]